MGIALHHPELDRDYTARSEGQARALEGSGWERVETTDDTAPTAPRRRGRPATATTAPEEN